MEYIYRVSEFYNETNGKAQIQEKHFYKLHEAEACFEKWVTEKDTIRKNKDLSLSSPHKLFMHDENYLKGVSWSNGYEITVLERIEVY